MTTKSAVAYSDSQGSKEAGEALALQLLKVFLIENQMFSLYFLLLNMITWNS